ncbi:hypothetical protein GUJ93_ZPchr0012g21993 [Zizania palustris]|uniref:Uncharacterized protein n=1 Tax=Zizania palustris TaxID=103762 RepID=A0A8J5WPZ2_ZIZPA|nr:hypothetical protein GUJ93_ZPchr0012g21993 [Zizania palustris]
MVAAYVEEKQDGGGRQGRGAGWRAAGKGNGTTTSGGGCERNGGSGWRRDDMRQEVITGVNGDYNFFGWRVVGGDYGRRRQEGPTAFEARDSSRRWREGVATTRDGRRGHIEGREVWLVSVRVLRTDSGEERSEKVRVRRSGRTMRRLWDCTRRFPRLSGVDEWFKSI